MIDNLFLGTYLGNEDSATDDRMLLAIDLAVKNRLVSFDCAPNYRNTRSEKVLGKFLSKQKEMRPNLTIATKGGFIPYDFSNTSDEREKEYLNKYVESGIFTIDSVNQYYFQCFSVSYLEHELNNSLSRMCIDYVDIYYLHNMEYLLRTKGEDLFYKEIEIIFNWIKRKISEGKIKYFGIASWDGLFSENLVNIQLEKMCDLANKVGVGKEFKYIQFPLNLLNIHSYTSTTQMYENNSYSLMSLIDKFQLKAVCNAIFAQGKVQNIKNKISQSVLLGDNIFVQSLNFVLSAPGISHFIFGCIDDKHLLDNINIVNKSRYNSSNFYAFFTKE